MDPVIQREKEGSNQPLASTQESEAENTKAGCPDQEGFITEMHKKRRQREEVSPQKFVTKCCRKTLNDSKKCAIMSMQYYFPSL